MHRYILTSMKILTIILSIIVHFTAVVAHESKKASFSPHSYFNLQNNNDTITENHASEILSLIINNQSKSDWHKIKKVNDFYNQNIQYTVDQQLWSIDDYWATPLETIVHGKGDCEDYAIAKFFTLKALGVDEHKLRLMYVRHLTLDQPHMVLIYFNDPESQPLVLDNFNQTILSVSKRTDLKPIYSFNNEGVWMAKADGFGYKVINSRGVSNWDNLLLKITAENKLRDTKP